MCDMCKRDTGVDYSIEGSNSTLTVCPNCVAESISYGTLDIPAGNFKSEISGNNGAVKIKSYFSDLERDTFFVTPQEAVRFLGHALMPNEYAALAMLHGSEQFELHDDFYTENGLAYQPVNDESYAKDLENYCRKHPKNAEVKNWLNEIKSYIDQENDYENT